MKNNNLLFFPDCLKKLSGNVAVAILWVALTFISFQQFPATPPKSIQELFGFFVHMLSVSLMTGIFLWASTGKLQNLFMYITSPDLLAAIALSIASFYIALAAHAELAHFIVPHLYHNTLNYHLRVDFSAVLLDIPQAIFFTVLFFVALHNKKLRSVIINKNDIALIFSLLKTALIALILFGIMKEICAGLINYSLLFWIPLLAFGLIQYITVLCMLMQKVIAPQSGQVSVKNHHF